MFNLTSRWQGHLKWGREGRAGVGGCMQAKTLMKQQSCLEVFLTASSSRALGSQCNSTTQVLYDYANAEARRETGAGQNKKKKEKKTSASMSFIF